MELSETAPPIAARRKHITHRLTITIEDLRGSFDRCKTNASGCNEAYNLIMARGWESKSVEQQQEEATSSQSQGKVLTPEQILEQRKRKGLELSRQRVLQQLEIASNPQHRSMLDAALAELDAQLKASAQ